MPGAAHRLLALQGQDLSGGCYALAQRAAKTTTRAEVTAAFNRGEIVRSWTMRGTLHLTAARDVRWLVALSRERTLRSMARRLRELQIEPSDIDRAAGIIASHLRVHTQAGRPALFALLNEHGIATAGQRGVHLLLTLVLDGLICPGPIPEGAGTTGQDFVLLEDWVSEHHVPAEPLAEILLRYLAGHGPASLRDAAWYTGQTLGELKRAAGQLADALTALGVDARGEELLVPTESDAQLMHEEGYVPRMPLRLLGPFDEYYLSYADRSLVADERMRRQIAPGANGMFLPFWLRHGRAEAVWNAQAAPADRIGAALHERYLAFRSPDR